ncbi:MAG: hypothetical protein AB1505_04630 [Candidatus Latescibacterota bacterium]
MPQREQEVLRLLLGLDGDGPLPPHEVARRTGLGVREVARLRTSALGRLRRHAALTEN